MLRLKIAASVAILWLCAGGAFAQSYWGQKLPKQPGNFVFGYGSLINSGSRASTLPSPRVVVPTRISADFGYTRCWCSPADSGFMALGIRKPSPAEKAATINGVIFPVGDDEMQDLDRRESDYDRIEISRPLIESVSWLALPSSGRIWIYVPKAGPEGQHSAVPSVEFPILQSYVDVVIEGGMEFSPDFAKEIIATTTDWSDYWLNDRELPRRPWVYNKMSDAIDRVLKSTEPSAAHYRARVFSPADMRSKSDERTRK